MAARKRLRSPCAARVWPLVSTVIALGLLVIALPGFASAETVSALTSFDDRFAAVESPDQLPQARSAAPAEAPKDRAGDIAKLRVPSRAPDGRARYRALIEKEAAQAGLPPEVAEAVMAVESGYNPDAIGGVGEIGLMQILPSTATMLGFRGSLAELAVPETNIRYGVTYLAKAWRLAGGDLCTAAMKYRAGHGETRFSVLSVNYCHAVRAKLAARGFSVTGSVPVATFGEPARGGGCGRKCLGVSRIGTVNIAALNTRLSALVVQARAGR
ncbi:transglycosylase SLT domain-containing protein [Bradyrhizobium sp. CSA112]|uniref:lytic transglycosylase domain-containing protein n=1 Tax=Bradyrhizobium sp. CSA112 TaxID=2699170 RepID=UPI0023AFE18D|nr:transglycosylase SLT domain-containing protein [Bradyrhizobium sp. CSA112]MDE5457050.1 transglycosylase SLT domain-containing protein [Bradyrhizobium sp. CSA112]